MNRYPYQDEHEDVSPGPGNWPVEGFAMNEACFVQIRIMGCIDVKPPYDGYPQIDSYTKVYHWWEVRLYFRPYGQHSVPDGYDYYAEIRNKKTTNLLPEKDVWQCIARFQTEEEAKFFVHKMHQSTHKENFFVEFSE